MKKLPHWHSGGSSLPAGLVGVFKQIGLEQLVLQTG